MLNPKFAIVDVETTGLNPERDRIIEAGVILLEENQVRSEHHFLISPEMKLKPVIVHLTGITDSDLKGMPLFEDVAHELYDLLHNRVLIGHNIRFDYAFLKMSFGMAGMAFSASTVCTRDLSEFVFPGMRSFSLKSMCRKFKIETGKPHRAIPDARRTAQLYSALIQITGKQFIHSLLSGKGNNTLIPAHLRTLVNQQLPETPGVYYFIGVRNKPVYIGKAINIRQRVLTHFKGEGNSLKILAFAAGIKSITYKETGNEILACLLEDHEIRHYWPSGNQAQKRNRIRFGIESYVDQLGRPRLTITRSVRPRNSHFTFYQYYLAADFLRNLAVQYSLNGPLCGIPDLNTDIDADTHQSNIDFMLRNEVLSLRISIYILEDSHPGRKSFIWLENGFYKGFGRISSDLADRPEELRNHLISRYSSATTEGIIARLRESRSPDLEFIQTHQNPVQELTSAFENGMI